MFSKDKCKCAVSENMSPCKEEEGRGGKEKGSQNIPKGHNPLKKCPMLHEQVEAPPRNHPKQSFDGSTFRILMKHF